MEYEFMTAATPLPPCMPFPKALAGLPISSTAKVMYCKMLDAMITKKLEDENGILFVYFPVRQLAAELSRCEMTVKRSLNELENVGLIMRVRRRGFAELNRIYILIPKKGTEKHKNILSKVVGKCIINPVTIGTCRSKGGTHT